MTESNLGCKNEIPNYITFIVINGNIAKSITSDKNGGDAYDSGTNNYSDIVTVAMTTIMTSRWL